MSDKLTSTSSIATTGVLTLTTRLYLNPVEAATFAAVTAGQAYPTVTVGAGNAYVQIVTVITPDTPLTLDAAEVQKYVGDGSNSQFTGVTQ